MSININGHYPSDSHITNIIVTFDNNNNNILFRHLNNSRNNSLKCNQIIILNQIMIIKDVSSSVF